MKQETDPKVIEKIKKLMALADPSRGGEAGEVQNAMSLMNKLMSQHNISMSEISLEEKIDIEEEMGAHLRYWAQWEQDLCIVFKGLCDVEPYINWRRNRNPKATQREMRIMFMGTRHDIGLASELYKIFRSTIKKGARQYKSYADQRSYAEGFVRALIHKANTMKRNRETGTGMIFVGRKTQALNQYRENLKLGTHKPKQTNAVTTGAYHHGNSDGQKMNMGTQKMIGGN